MHSRRTAIGTWGVGVFENDDANDLLSSFRKTYDAGVLERAARDVLAHETDYLEAPESQRCLAAAGIVVNLNNFDKKASKAGEPWLDPENLTRIRSNKDLIVQLNLSVERILREPSELLELWEESPEFQQWKDVVVDLQAEVQNTLN